MQFYTVINGFLGAFTTSFETFIIPCAVYNYVYWRQEARNNCPRPPFQLGHLPYTCRSVGFRVQGSII